MADADRQLWRVSVKGVVLQRDRVLLLRNDRQEWELPGGGLEAGETPPECVVRELREETGWAVRCEALLDTWVYRVAPSGGEVLIVTYGCTLINEATEPVLSAEHQEVGLFGPDDVAQLPMPDGYRTSIAAWRATLHRT